jgi:hypothetical protein
MRQRVDDLAVGSGGIESGQVLGHRAPGHGQAVAVEQAGIEQFAHDHGETADAVDVGHVVAAVGLGVGDVGDAGTHPVEVVEGQIDTGLVGDGQEVEHGVGRAAEGHDDGDGVLERLLGHDLAGPDVALQQSDHGLAGVEGTVVASAVDGGGDADPGSDMPMASATDAMVLAVNIPAHEPAVGQALCSMSDKLGVAQGPGGVGAHRFEDAHDVEGLVTGVAGKDGAAVDEDGGQVEPGRRHQHAGQRLVATGEGHHAVEALGVHHVSTESAMTSRDTSDARMPS